MMIKIITTRNYCTKLLYDDKIIIITRNYCTTLLYGDKIIIITHLLHCI